MNEADQEDAWAMLARLGNGWREVVPSGALRSHAIRLVRLHPLRAADALQLAAALDWMERAPDGAVFITADRQLGRAARAEGFDVWSPLAPPPA